MKRNYRNASNNTKFKSIRFSDYNHDNHERLLTNSMRINIFLFVRFSAQPSPGIGCGQVICLPRLNLN